MVEAQAKRWALRQKGPRDALPERSPNAGERAEAVVLVAYLAKFSAWPLTAQALKGEPLAELARGLPPTDLMMNTV
jgi:hypothetical protein